MLGEWICVQHTVTVCASTATALLQPACIGQWLVQTFARPGRSKETYPQHVVQLLGVSTEGYLVHEALKVVQGMAATSLLAFNLHLCFAP